MGGPANDSTPASPRDFNVAIDHLRPVLFKEPYQRQQARLLAERTRHFNLPSQYELGGHLILAVASDTIRPLSESRPVSPPSAATAPHLSER